MTPAEKQRFDRLEAAVNALAYLETRFAGIPPGLCPELDAIRLERVGSIVPGGGPRLSMETRPAPALEQREAVV
jgi:hypothetical protein